MGCSKTFCALAWGHAHIEADGGVRPCCMAVDNIEIGSLKRQDLMEIINAQELKSMRVAMIKGEVHPLCRHCHDLEKVGQKTLRQFSNEKLLKEAQIALAKTLPDGHLVDPKIYSLDIRFSNLCNFKCRTCNETASSTWYEDINKLQPNSNLRQLIKPMEDSESWWALIEKIIPSLKEVYILGGEPLIDPDHFLFLDKLQAMGKLDLPLRYSTNLSSLHFKGRSVFDYWSPFSKITLSLSYDGVEKKGEFIRKGQNWKKIVLNHKELQAHNNISYVITPTLSVLNVFHLPEMVEYFLEHQMITHGEELGVSILGQPDYYNIKILSREDRLKVKKSYESFLSNILPRYSLSGGALIEEQFHRVLLYLDQNALTDQEQTQWRRRFVAHSLMLNKIRHEHMLALFPELHSFFLDAAQSLGNT